MLLPQVSAASFLRAPRTSWLVALSNLSKPVRQHNDAEFSDAVAAFIPEMNYSETPKHSSRAEEQEVKHSKRLCEDEISLNFVEESDSFLSSY